MRSLSSPTHRLALLVFVLPALVPLGCGSKKASISGKVTYQGKAITGGFVNFISEGPNATTKTSNIEKDGSYSVTGVPPGPAKITVQGVPPPRKFQAPQAMQNKPGVADAKSDQPEEVFVPPQYSSPDQTDLKYDVQPGSQTHNIDLK